MKPYFETNLGKLYYGDCLEIMPELEPVDLVLCDLPYGTTSCSWDVIIPFDALWQCYKKLLKKNTPIVLTASQPFTSILINSNIEMFKYEWIWDKVLHGNFLLAKTQPLKIHENVIVFSLGTHKYNPQMTRGIRRLTGGGISKLWNMEMTKRWNDNYYPRSIFCFPNTRRGDHPTQKPVSLFAYLIETYSDEKDVVLDNCLGSGTTAIAAERLNRRWIGIESDEEYCELSAKRIEREAQQLKLFAV